MKGMGSELSVLSLDSEVAVLTSKSKASKHDQREVKL
jgi:hypothetical protein